MGYANTGPFVDNGAPAISANFFNNVENFLDTVNSMATDTHNSSDGAGNATVASLTLSHGKISRIARFSGTGIGSPQIIAHGLGAVPDMVIAQYTGNFGIPPGRPTYWYNATTTQVTIWAENAYLWWALAFKF